jgi:hypothetical protein
MYLWHWQLRHAKRRGAAVVLNAKVFCRLLLVGMMDIATAAGLRPTFLDEPTTPSCTKKAVNFFFSYPFPSFDGSCRRCTDSET